MAHFNSSISKHWHFGYFKLPQSLQIIKKKTKNTNQLFGFSASIWPGVGYLMHDLSSNPLDYVCKNSADDFTIMLYNSTALK